MFEIFVRRKCGVSFRGLESIAEGWPAGYPYPGIRDIH